MSYLAVLMELHSISNGTICTYLVHNETTNGTCLAFLMRLHALGDYYTRFLMGLGRFVMGPTSPWLTGTLLARLLSIAGDSVGSHGGWRVPYAWDYVRGRARYTRFSNGTRQDSNCLYLAFLMRPL